MKYIAVFDRHGFFVRGFRTNKLAWTIAKGEAEFGHTVEVY